MRVFKGRKFSRWASGEGISDEDLCKAAQEAFTGRAEADLGGYLFKKRVARTGGGKSGGYRTILGFRKGNSDRIFFLHGFPKSARPNISAREKIALATVAAPLIGATDKQIEQLASKGSIAELECET